MEKLYKVIEGLVLGVVFFGLVAPISICYRLMGRDLLNLKLHRAQKSYWIERTQPKLISKGFFTQFISK